MRAAAIAIRALYAAATASSRLRSASSFAALARLASVFAVAAFRLASPSFFFARFALATARCSLWLAR